MTIYAIADLHLSDGDKPMDVFGAHWAGHFDRIREDWRARVREEDVVLLPGDLSWAMQLEDAMRHIEELAPLPGRKILVRGNHDYWWSSIGRLRERLPRGMYALQNDALLMDGALFAGTRGWVLPGEGSDADDARIFARETLRLEMSLRAARAISQEAPLYAMIHYPPLSGACRDTAFTRLLERYRVRCAVYGHLHGPALRQAFSGPHNGVKYRLVSCDGLDFQLAEVDRLEMLKVD